MSEYLKRINREYNQKEFNDWYIDDIFAFPHNSSDAMENIIFKYSKSFSQNSNFRLEDVETSDVLIELENEYNVLIKSFLNYLLACSSKRSVSKLVENCNELMNLYFANIDKINGGAPIHNLTTVLSWTVHKFPREGKIAISKIYDRIINNSSKTIRYFSIAEYFIREKDLVNMFNADEYAKIFDKYYVMKTDAKNVYLYLDFYSSYIKYLENNDKSRKKSFLKKYCYFVINNLDNLDCHTKSTILPKVRDYMDVLNYGNAEYAVIDNNIKSAIDEISNTFEEYSIVFHKNIQKKITTFIEHQNELYNKLSNADKIESLIFDSTPLKIDDVKNYVEFQKSGLTAFFDESVSVDDKMIYYRDLKPEEEFSLRAYQYFEFYIGIYFNTYVNSFVKSFKLDDESKNYIRHIFENNRLVNKERAENLCMYFIDFFDNDYIHSVYDIVEELEESLRYYFRENGLNIIKRNGTHDLIGLSDILNAREKNEYRDKLYETIDEDFYFTLKWLLVDKYGFELRNKIAHRYSHPDLYKTTFAIFSVIQIFRLYWGFQCS